MKKGNKVPLLNSDSGVLFAYRGSETSGNKMLSIIMGTVFSYIIALSLIFGSLLTFTTMFAVQMHTTLFIVLTAILALGLIIIFQMPKKIIGFSMLGILAIIGIIFIFYWNEMISGFEYVRDFVLVGVAKAMYWTVPELSYRFNEAMKVDTTVIMLLVAIPVVTAITFFTVRKINFILPFLITFPFFEIGAAFGCVPDHYAFAALLAGWTGLFAMYAAAKIRKIKKRKRDKKKSKVTAAERRQSFIASIGIAVALLTFGTFSFGNIMLGIAGYDRPENMMKLREDFKDTVTDIIDYILGVDNDGSLREGRLYQMGDRIIKDRRYLTVELPKGTQNYLRGYVGAIYNGDRWDPISQNSELEWMESAFESSGYYPPNMQGELLKNMEKEFTDVKASTISISNLRRKKDYAFTAYVPYFNDDFTFSGDSVVIPDDKSEYTYSAYMDSEIHYMVDMSNLYKDSKFSLVWEEYSKFVEKTYTQVPDDYDEITKIVYDLVNGKGYGLKGVAQTDLQIADRIRSYLTKTIEYSLMVQKLPANTDFVEWLLNDGKKGYSAHYATAMTLMLRLANIPARYVEGYVITELDYENATDTKDGYCSMDLTDLNAHAWLEIYDSTYGWIPIEATPGFYIGNLADEAIILPEEPQQGGADDSAENEFEAMDELPPEDYIDNPDSEIIIYEDIDPDELDGPGAEEEKEQSEEREEMEEEEGVLATVLKVFKYTLIFIGIAAGAFVPLSLLTFGILYIRRSINISKLDNAIRHKDYNKRVTEIYKYYNRLLRFENIENDEKTSYLEYAEYICSKSDRLRGEQHLRAMAIFLKYRFSNEILSDNELICLENLTMEYRKNSLSSLGGKEKFRFIYIENLG